MSPEVIKPWLQRKKSSGVISCLLLAGAALVGGWVVLFLTFWFAYAIVWFGFDGISALSSLLFSKKPHLAHEWRLIMSAVFLVLLFIQHFRTSPWHWGNYPHRSDYSLLAGHVLGPWALLKYPGASANMITDILLTGPRLVIGAWNLIQGCARLRRLDVEGCSQLLAFLVSRPVVVSFDELREAGWESWLEQLRGIEGVVFLKKGLNLTAELRTELASLDTG